MIRKQEQEKYRIYIYILKLTACALKTYQGTAPNKINVNKRIHLNLHLYYN